MLNDKDNRLFAPEIAARLGVATETVRLWFRSGRIATDLPLHKNRSGRIWAWREDVERFAGIYWREAGVA